jgi:hypothetical protein
VESRSQARIRRVDAVQASYVNRRPPKVGHVPEGAPTVLQTSGLYEARLPP